MTSRFVRPSKYRHTFPQQGRKEWNYENLKVSSSAWDTDLIKSSSKFLSINYQVAGGGAFAILPLLSPFHSLSPLPTPKLPDLIPLARGHSGAVLDTAWSPHSESFLASGGEDGKILLWDFANELSNAAHGSTQTYAGKFDGWGEEGFTLPSDWQHTSSIPSAGKGRKVGQLVFNPVVKELLASASGDQVVRVWDLASQKGDAVLELKGHGDTIQSMCWGYDGGVIITTARDKKIRMYDPRSSSSPIKTSDSHGGIKGSRVCWLGDRDRVVTTGFSRMSDRQMILWDTKDLTPIKEETIDSSSGVIMPHYIEGNGVLLLAGKGDGNIRLYEYADDDLFYLTEHKSQDPQRGFTLLPRHAVDVAQNEIARGFKLTTSTVEPIAFVVPRKAENFQADIFPPAPSMEPAFTPQEWLDGKNGPPKFIDMESRASAAYTAPAQKEETKKEPVVTPSPPAAQKEQKKEEVSPVRTPSPIHATEYSKDVPMPSATEIPETVHSPTKDFDPKDLEIKQDDPESDEEETEAKRRAPADDDFAEEATPSVVDVSGKGKKEEKEVVKEEPSVTQSKSDDGSAAALASLQAEHSALKKRFDAIQKENDEYKALIKRAKSVLSTV